MTSNNIYDKANSELQEKVAQLPITLSVQDIATLLGISRSSAYTLVGKPDFPKKKVNGMRRYIIPKVKFMEWYLSTNIE